ncbi:SDR family NAD(P)-dependent oxidoreductase [Rhodovulum sp. DZ06]|uniref:SDR family NAD(P)-dependent oxidoreductase n=1 Tax=Rhodovulum sp. DZ06 TaxID=3425126 RepID=UPI003D353258
MSGAGPGPGPDAAALFDVRGKVALVTGAGFGLGRAIAEALASGGARLALIDRDEAALAAACAALRDAGAEALALPGDVTDPGAVPAAAASARARWGRIDICVANAGVSDRTGALFHEADPAEFARVQAVNLDGMVHTCRAVLGGMAAQGSGKVILVASMWGHAAPAGLSPRPAYAATKAAAVGLARELGVQYAPHGVQVNALCPGFFRTETRPRSPEQEAQFAAYTPAGRIAEAAEIKGAALFLASPASDFVTGTSLVIDGGVLAR